jgi:radical SAM protein with 4Fe4S-binding SPASM domain
MGVVATSYSDFSRSIHSKALRMRIPLGGSIEVTHRCPLRCVHCYNNLPVHDRIAGSTELNYHEHCRILDQVAEQGCLWILFTGGEIFVRRDFLDIYDYAKRKGFLITLFTNGVMIGQEIADHLAHSPPLSIEITIYGRTKRTYEAVTGVAGSYERFIRAVELLMERGLPLKLKTMAIRQNVHELWDMKHFAEEELGVPFKFDAMINPRLDCSQEPLATRLTPEEIVSLDMKDPRRRSEWRRFASQFMGNAKSSEESDRLYRCGAGVCSFAIRPDGVLSPCVISPQDTWDLRRGDFEEGWHKFMERLSRTSATRDNKCRRCQLMPMCGMCPANAELENGDPEEPVDFLCQVAHLRAYAMEIPFASHGPCEYCRGGGRHEEMVRKVRFIRAYEKEVA